MTKNDINDDEWKYFLRRHSFICKIFKKHYIRKKLEKYFLFTS